ncbi:MAG: hypothetical protein IPM50_10100 [Acidobacteriota bacterium]|nr:MAG: hypothetical protein IPM50_10100 [Acidobacteriota bacterium]
MKKKLAIFMAAIMVFGLAFAVYAYTSNTTTSDKKASCCDKMKDGESCPMKMGKAATGEKTAAGEKASCCGCDCCGDCCAGHAEKTTAEGTKADGKSCPMMNGEGHKMAADAVHAEKGANECCGCSCACCAGKKKAETAV